MNIDRRILDDMSDRVLNEFLKGVDPENSIVSLADNCGMNEEQAKRLCEISNRKIKVYLSKTKPDQSFTFPLADATKVIETLRLSDGDEMQEQEKTASLIELSDVDDAWFESILGAGIEKNGSEALTAEERAEKTAFIITHLDRADTKLTKDVAVLSDNIVKLAEDLTNHLRSDWLDSANLNRSYTAAIASTDPSDHIVVDTLFKTASEALKTSMHMPEISWEQIKTAQVNPRSEFALTLREYIDSRRELIKAASALKRIVEERKRLMSKYISLAREE